MVLIKLLNGDLYEYKAQTCLEVKELLSKEFDRNIGLIKIFDDEKKVENETILEDEKTYNVVFLTRVTLDWVREDKLIWEIVCRLPQAIHLIEMNLDKVNWSELSWNKKAFKILEENIDKIDWGKIPYTRDFMPLLEKNMDKIFWDKISYCPDAIHILEANMDKIDWEA